MKSTPFIIILVSASLIIGITLGWYVGSKRASYRHTLASINGAYIFDSEAKNNHVDKAVSYAESEIVWNFAILRKYPKWASWRQDNGTKGGWTGDKILQYIPEDRIKQLAFPCGLSEPDIRKVANEIYTK